MASDLYMNFLWAFEEIGKDLNKGEEYFEKLYSYIPKDELDEYKHQFLAEDLNEALEDYKLIYYLSTATAERRPETIEDVENDWKEETFAADSDLDACKYAYEKIQLSYMDDFDFNTVADFVEYCEEKDLGDGSAFVVKLEGPNGVIYDMGQTKDDFIEQVKENDEMLSYYRKVLGIDESLNEGNLDILNTEKDDNKMNEDMSVRAKLKALYPELNFGDEAVEGFDDDMKFDIDESHETRLMGSLYEGSDDFDEHDDEDIDEFSDCEDDECWENDLISDDYDDVTDEDYLDEDLNTVPESDEEHGKYIWKIAFDTTSSEYEATNDVDDIYAHGATLKDCIEDLRSLVNEQAEIDGSVVVKKFSDKHVDYTERDLDNLGYVIVKFGRFKFW